MARDERPFTKIAGNDKLEVYRYSEYGAPRIMVHALDAHDHRAGLACALVERWGVVAGIPDGEDSAGRQKIELMPVDQLVQRACDTSQALHDAFAQRGWTLAVPALDADGPEKDNQ